MASTTEKYLFEDLKPKAYDLDIPKVRLTEHAYITENLKYKLFEWQERALVNFLTYEAIKEKEEDFAPKHLLFNMATGAGKTLVMAALILYYYKKGYRNFIFFVNQNNIVGKTEENLCNPSHHKYLFAQNIVVDDKNISIKKVNTFADDCEDIQIKFTSIHSLHNDVYKVKEDNLFLQDLQAKKLVMLGDEAHHLNADTKKSKIGALDLFSGNTLTENASQDDVENSWENTVIKLLLKRGGNKATESPNVLLEFTATVPENKEVRAKYLPKTIIKFDLKNFLKAGYTKEINLISSSFDKKKRILQALLFNWYRHKIALKNNIQNFKAVILFRSKTIEDSVEDFETFKTIIADLQVSDFDFLHQIDEHKLMNIAETYQKGQSRIIDLKRFIVESGVSMKEIIDYLQDAFADRNCIITNSKNNKTKKEKTNDEIDRLLNNLEDKENNIQAIFTVQRLTEGWDVQNLFDIVRLYEGQNAGGTNKGKAGGATTSEVQLIGRGVRYCPFKFGDKEPNKRKFDHDLNHELRVLEEFYFHSDNDERYLSELKKELKERQWIDDTKVPKNYALKESFLRANKDLKLFVNDRLENPEKRKKELSELKKDFCFDYKIESPSIIESTLNLDVEELNIDKEKYNSTQSESATLVLTLKNFEANHLHIIRKAISLHAKKDNSIFRFSNLCKELAIDSIDDVLENAFLGNLKINVQIPKKNYNNSTAESILNIPNEDILKLLTRFFEKLGNDLKQISNPYIGSAFRAEKITKLFPNKLKSIIPDEANTKLELELLSKDWYALNGFHGTSEERNLIHFLKDVMGNFEAKYENIQLLRNEEVYKIYDFKTGQGFQPDFILILKQKSKNLYYQVFIEPKGDQFKDQNGLFENSKEGWKEAFLQEISAKYGIGNLLHAENNDYKLIGLPLYNEKNTGTFKSKINEMLAVEA